MVPFYSPSSSVPRNALPVQPTEDPRSIVPGVRNGSGLSAETTSQGTLAGPFLSAPPTLERVSEHQTRIFNSTMPTRNNTIPTSFLLWLRLGEEGGQEAVTTSIFPQSNPSLTSHQSGVSSQCPCSLVSNQTEPGGLFAKISLLRHRDACLPQRTLFALYLPLLVVCTKEKPWQCKPCVLTHHMAFMVSQFL